MKFSFAETTSCSIHTCHPHCQVAASDASRRASLAEDRASAAELRATEVQAAAEAERQRLAERQLAHLEVWMGECDEGSLKVWLPA